MTEAVDSGTLWLVIGIAGSVILILLGVVGVLLRGYMKTVHDDVKSNTEAIGRNKGNIELVKQKQEQDKRHIEEMTQIKLQALTDTTDRLANNVDTLVKAFISSGVKIDKDGD